MLPPKEVLLFSQAHERGKSQVQTRAMHFILTVAVLSCLCFPWKILGLECRARPAFHFCKAPSRSSKGQKAITEEDFKPLSRAAVTIVWSRNAGGEAESVCPAHPPLPSLQWDQVWELCKPLCCWTAKSLLESGTSERRSCMICFSR